jgi:hypothetical protein
LAEVVGAAAGFFGDLLEESNVGLEATELDAGGAGDAADDGCEGSCA